MATVSGDEYTPTKPFDADCWRCANLAADRLPETDIADRMARRMYLCPECGNKRCRKAADHEFRCDQGAAEIASMHVRREFNATRIREAQAVAWQEGWNARAEYVSHAPGYWLGENPYRTNERTTDDSR